MRWVVFAVVLILAPTAAAKTLSVELGPGDSLETIAEYFYGDAWKAVYLRTHNGLNGNDADPGTKVVVPRSWTHEVKRGQTFASLARRYLFDTDRYKVLMRFNQTSNPNELAVGQSLLMPFHLQHEVRAGEGLSQIAKIYYSDAKLAGTLKEYNGLTKSALEVGQKLVVPIFDRATLDAESKVWPPPAGEEASKDAVPPQPASAEKAAEPTVARDNSVVAAARGDEAPTLGSPTSGRSPPPGPTDEAAKKPADATEAKALLEEAIAAYRRGYFGVACKSLESLLEPAGDAKTRSRVLEFLAYCAIAQGDATAAKDYFRSWLLTDPEASLDRRLTSPKILTIFDRVAADIRR